MLINGTLLVQIFNFLIFYWLFKRVFLSSAVRVVQAEMNYKNLLENKIEKSNKEVVLQKDYQEEILKDCRLQAENNKPNIFDLGVDGFKPTYQNFPNIELTVDKKAVVEDLKNFILKNAEKNL